MLGRQTGYAYHHRDAVVNHLGNDACNEAPLFVRQGAEFAPTEDMGDTVCPRLDIELEGTPQAVFVDRPLFVERGNPYGEQAPKLCTQCNLLI